MTTTQLSPRSLLRSCLWLVILYCYCLTLGCSQLEPVTVQPTPGLDGFAAQLDEIRVDLQIPGLSAAIVKDGAVEWSQGFGYADVLAAQRATPTTAYHLASLTKTFAAVIIMQLVEEGRLDLQMPISTWDIDLPGANDITVRHLMTHTSEEVSGSTFRYNGNRFGELAKIIERVTGRPFADLLVARILEPLELRHTAPNVKDSKSFRFSALDKTEFLANLATGYEVRESAIWARDYPRIFGTAGGLIGSVVDVAAWSIAIDEGRFLKPETWDLIFTPAVDLAGNTLPYALGWFIHEYRGVRFEWHYGWWVANSSLLIRVPEQGLTFVAAANTDAMSSRYGLGGDSDLMRSDIARLFVETYVFTDTSVEALDATASGP